MHTYAATVVLRCRRQLCLSRRGNLVWVVAETKRDPMHTLPHRAKQTCRAAEITRSYGEATK